MDFKSFVNKESFKAILLQHLKIQAKHKLGCIITDRIKEDLSSRENSPPEDIVDLVSKSFLESNEYPDFLSSFLQNMDSLLDDEDKYVPKDEKQDNTSQCSSASSINTSSIDFLRPDQFQNTIHCLKVGTKVEKLEALETLHRLPTMEHLTNKSLWSDVERGLHDSLSSKIVFLRTAALKLYTKMLTSSESKVVQESYLSLVKYIVEVLLPSMNQIVNEDHAEDLLRFSVQIIAILNKFLQTISLHWLRYPQSVIENISAQSLCLLSNTNQVESAFPVWTCIAHCDPEVKWMKNIIYGHISRAAFLDALEKDSSILKFCLNFCNKFNSEQCDLTREVCCQNASFVTEITHMICFFAHLLQYCDGRNIFSTVSYAEDISCWTEVLGITMCCSQKLCKIACFNCCVTVCNVFSEKWFHFWNHITPNVYQDLMKILTSLFSDMQLQDLNLIYFAIQCLHYSFGYIINIFQDQCTNICDLIIQLLTYCKSISFSSDSTTSSIGILNIHKSILLFVKNIFSVSSVLFLELKFTESFGEWWSNFNENCISKFLSFKYSIFDNNETKIIDDIEQLFLDVNISLLKKPHILIVTQDISSFETSLNILLEKILKDIKARNSVCSSDVSILAYALNNNITLKKVLNKTIAFRLSSIIWQVNDTNYVGDLHMMRIILQSLLPSVFCDLVSINELTVVDQTEINVTDVKVNIELQLMQNVLMSSKLTNEFLACEDYNILLLHILSLLSSNFHSVCCLESKFKVSALLLEQQSYNITVDENPIIDPESILRNHILVKLYALGGPGERVLPDEEISNAEYKWPFVNSYPIQEIFFKSIPCTTDVDAELKDQLELFDLQKYFLDYLKVKARAPAEFCFQVLTKYSHVLCTNSEMSSNLNFISLDSAEYVLQKDELVGLDMVRRYGLALNLTAGEDDGKLDQLLKASKCLIGSKTNKLDVFVCTVYLMCKGDIDAGWRFLQNFAKTPNSFYVWFESLKHNAEISPQRHILHTTILEMCDFTVQRVLPQVFAVLQLFGVLPSMLFSYWVVQCYWNYLDFSEISHFVMLNILYPKMFSIYFFISVLKHQQTFILLNAHDCDLITNLKKNPIDNYKVCDYIDFILELSDNFSEMESKYLGDLNV